MSPPKKNNKTEVIVTELILCKCGKPGEKDHTCPYAEDICGDNEFLCNCCSECEHECCMDI